MTCCNCVFLTYSRDIMFDESVAAVFLYLLLKEGVGKCPKPTPPPLHLYNNPRTNTPSNCPTGLLTHDVSSNSFNLYCYREISRVQGLIHETTKDHGRCGMGPNMYWNIIFHMQPFGLRPLFLEVKYTREPYNLLHVAYLHVRTRRSKEKQYKSNKR